MSVDPLIENVRLAVACGADPAMVLTVALATAGPPTVLDALELLKKRGPEIAELARVGGALRHLAALEPEIAYEPELSRLRFDIGDHEVRGQLLYGDILGRRSFFQVAGLLIAGLDLSPTDAELLEHGGVLTLLADPRIWPLTIARRTAAHGGGLARSLVAGVAAICTPNMTALPVGGFMRVLDRVDTERQGGRSIDAVVQTMISNRERIAGLGRPITGVDERVAQQHALFERFGRADGESVRLARDLDRRFHEQKGLRVNSAGFHGALMRDLGFTPAQAAAFCMIYFIVPLLAHVTFATERGILTHEG